MTFRRLFCLLVALVSTGLPSVAMPANGNADVLLPRFVSLKRDEVYMRRGPGPDHQIVAIYVRRHLPLEVINEFDTWRQVRDPDGAQGWISVNMLSGDRWVMIRQRAPDGTTENKRWPLRKKPDAKANIVAVAEPGALAELKHCPDAWCQIEAQGHTGWIERDALWGLLPNERIQ